VAIKFTNNAFGTLANSILSTDTTINLTGGQGVRFPALAAGDWFYADLINASGTLEIIKVTARATDALTVVRGQDGTTAIAYTAGDRIELRLCNAALNDIINPIVQQVTGGSVAANAPTFDATQTWNNAGVTFTAARVNVTDTNSNVASLLLDLQIAGVSKFSVRKDGALVGATIASGQTLTLTGATIAGQPTWSSNQAITLSTAAQPNVTSVGTLTALAVSGTITAATIDSGSAASVFLQTNSGTQVIEAVNGTAGTHLTVTPGASQVSLAGSGSNALNLQGGSCQILLGGGGTGSISGTNYNVNTTFTMLGQLKMSGAPFIHARNAPTYSASITPNCNIANLFDITATNGSNFTINPPTGPVDGMVINICIRNASGGALGVVTFNNPAFKMSAFQAPATGFSRSYLFKYDGSNWVEIQHSSIDVPN
jgi:hypothetical protein